MYIQCCKSTEFSCSKNELVSYSALHERPETVQKQPSDNLAHIYLRARKNDCCVSSKKPWINNNREVLAKPRQTIKKQKNPRKNKTSEGLVQCQRLQAKMGSLLVPVQRPLLQFLRVRDNFGLSDPIRIIFRPCLNSKLHNQHLPDSTSTGERRRFHIMISC